MRRILLGSVLLIMTLMAAPGWPLALEKAAIRAYQNVASPMVGQVAVCRYRQTCSHYALAVLESEGFWKGNLKVAQRLSLCSPLQSIFPETARQVARQE